MLYIYIYIFITEWVMTIHDICLEPVSLMTILALCTSKKEVLYFVRLLTVDKCFYSQNLRYDWDK